MMLTKKPKIGEVVRNITGAYPHEHLGGTYEIIGYDYDGDAQIINDEGGRVYITKHGFHNYELVTDKPKKSARITALESQVATLQAKVEALESAGKYPLTERFERESTEVDAILADIERKAKPTLEALLATYPSPNQQRADVIKRAKAFVAEWTKRAASVKLLSPPLVVKAFNASSPTL